MNILCNIVNFLAYIQILLFLLLSCWYYAVVLQGLCDIIYNFNLINLIFYYKMKNSVFSRPSNIHHPQN